MNDYEIFDEDSIPKELTDKYEFAFTHSAGYGKTVLFRERSETEAPSHEEIMTKWWNMSGLWVRVDAYEPREPMPYSVNRLSGTVDKTYFQGLESADIPPEGHSVKGRIK